jgi:hypothetical protein
MTKLASTGVAATLVIGVSLFFIFDAGVWHGLLDHAWTPFKRNAEPWVAIGTILLALSTAFLAWSTRREIAIVAEQTRTSRDEVALSREALQQSIRPVLVDAPWDVARVELSFFAGANDQGEPFGAATCRVPLLNAGAGLALIESFELSGMDIPWQGRVRQTATPSGSLAWFDFSAEMDPGDAAALRDTLPRDKEEQTLQLDVSYSDIDGQQSTLTEAYIRGRLNTFRVDAVALRAPDGKPFMELSAVPRNTSSALSPGL